MTTFSIAAIDELWLRGTLVERRLMHGRAEEHGNEIVATVIYADEIKADVVIADHIYVKDVRRR